MVCRLRRSSIAWAAERDPATRTARGTRCGCIGQKRPDSMHRFETVFFRFVIERYDGVEPVQFLLKVLIHQQQGFKRPTHIAITGCYDFFDSKFSSLVRHAYSPTSTPLDHHCHIRQGLGQNSALEEIIW